MTTPRITPGFNVSGDDAPPPPARVAKPDVATSFISNHELITDLARFSEGQPLCTESAIRKKWRLSEETWELLGGSDEMIRAVEDAKAHRIRSGATKRELAQAHILRGPDVLASIMDDARASPRHKVDSIKALNAIADPGPEAEQRDVIIVKIDMSAGSDTKDPKDVLTIETTARPSTPKQLEDDRSESDEWRR